MNTDGPNPPLDDDRDGMIQMTSAHGDLSLIEIMTPVETSEPRVFEGLPNPYGVMGIYGGHFLGQALAAGLATVDEPKLAHSFHAYFLRKGNPEVPIEYRVAALRDGRGSDVRTISGWQEGAEAFHMIASFTVPGDGEEHQPTAPEAPSAEDLRAARQARGEELFPIPTIQNGWTDVEWVSPHMRAFEPGNFAGLQTWVRVPGGESLSERQRQVVMAFLSDGPLMFNSVVPYGVAMETHWATSLDQSVWFHRTPDPSEWMLYDQRSTAAAGGRGMNTGEIFAGDGMLLMTCAQESVLRRMPAEG